MFLLDTNVVSELRKLKSSKADRNFAAWAHRADTPGLFMSVITLEELEIGVLLSERRNPATGQVLRAWLDGQVLSAFVGRILPIDNAVALRGATLHVPNPRPVRDALIAATALVHGMTVVTRNVADFAPTGVPTLNPWASRAGADQLTS